MSYEKGQRIRMGEHYLTDKGEFAAIMRDFGLEVAIDCWCTTHDILSLVIKCALGLALGCGVGAVIAKAAGLL